MNLDGAIGAKRPAGFCNYLHLPLARASEAVVLGHYKRPRIGDYVVYESERKIAPQADRHVNALCSWGLTRLGADQPKDDA